MKSSGSQRQLRKMDRTLEMLETGHVQRIGVTSDMEEWWDQQVKKTHAAQPETASPKAGQAGKGKEMEKAEKPKERESQSSKESVTDRGDSADDNQQWGGALPGHGGT